MSDVGTLAEGDSIVLCFPGIPCVTGLVMCRGAAPGLGTGMLTCIGVRSLHSSLCFPLVFRCISGRQKNVRFILLIHFSTLFFLIVSFNSLTLR